MKVRTYLKSVYLVSVFSLVFVVVLVYFSAIFLSQRLSSEDFQSYLFIFGIPLGAVALLSALFVVYVYVFKYLGFVKVYKEEYNFLISKVFSDTEVRKVSLIEGIFKGLEKDESGVYNILPQEDEFGEFGRVINILLSNIYNQDVEKSRLLSFQKEVINKLLGFTNVPVVIVRKAHRKKPAVIVSNLNIAFLKAIKAENVVRLATRLLDVLKVKQASDKYLYDMVVDVVRAEDIEELKRVFTGQEIGIEEFLVELEWFFCPADDRAKKILTLLKELVKGSDLIEMEKNLVLEVFDYETYRKEYSLPESITTVEGFIAPVAPDDETTFIKKRQDSFYREGLKLKKFRFFLAKGDGGSAKEPVFESSITVVPATSKHFSPEKMLLLCFDEISVH